MKLSILCAACTAFILLSCESRERNMQPAEKTSATSGIELANVEKKESVSVDTVSPPSTSNNMFHSGSPLNAEWDKKIIKTANVTLELKDYNSYDASIHGRIKTYGAYIAQEQQNETDYQISNTVTIKVPVDKFEDLLNSLPAEDTKLLEKNIFTEDVAGEVVDTKARIEAKKQVRAKYLELLKQAKNMDDILQVQNEINSIQEAIESATGRVNYLVHSSSYSTINLKYFQKLNEPKPDERAPGFFTKLTDAFKSGALIVADLVLFCVSAWPFIILAMAAVVYFRRLSGKKA